MGTLTYSELSDEIKQSHAMRKDLTDARVVASLNLAQMRIARVYRWEELEVLYERNTNYTGEEDDKFLPMPVEFRDFYSIRLVDGTRSKRLTFIPHRVWDRKIPAPQAYARGRPSHYTYWRRTLELWRMPDAEYLLRVRGIIWPTKFTGITTPLQVSDLDQKDDALVALSVSYLYSKLGNRDKASSWWAIYSNMLNSMVSEEIERPDEMHLPHHGETGGTGFMNTLDYVANPFVNEAP